MRTERNNYWGDVPRKFQSFVWSLDAGLHGAFGPEYGRVEVDQPRESHATKIGLAGEFGLTRLARRQGTTSRIASTAVPSLASSARDRGIAERLSAPPGVVDI